MSGNANGIEGLTRNERAVMRAVYALSGGKERFLTSPYEILRMLPERGKYDEDKVEEALGALSLDGYFSLVTTDRKGERAYCVIMHEEGLAFARLDLRRRRSLRLRLFITVLCGALSAVVGIILRAIFK